MSTTPSLSARKRPLDDHDDANQERIKRRAVGEVHTAPIDQKNRMELYLMLQSCKTWDTYRQILNLAYQDDEFKLALALNDSPERLRLKALEHLDEDSRPRIIRLISEIQLDQRYFDPSSLFPSIITHKIQKIQKI